MLKSLMRTLLPNPLDSLLAKVKQENKKRFLLTWNRGLGDIALGLYAIAYRIREYIPDATITFLTRADLMEGFALLPQITAISCPEWKRGLAFDLSATLAARKMSREDFDVIMENPDPTWWVKWQLGNLVPKMKWKQEWDEISHRFGLQKKKYIGVHVQTETSYGYEKNWPLSHWQEFFQRILREAQAVPILFGNKPDPLFEGEEIVDLRGKTSLVEMLSIIKNFCTYLLVPDSGVLSLTYFLDQRFPLRIVSLWADPNQGVLKQNVPSPNSELIHIPLLGKDEKISNIDVESVIEALFSNNKEKIHA